MKQQTIKTNDHKISEESQRDSAADVIKLSARCELAAGVLKQAAQDLRRFRGATSKLERELYLDAHHWVTVDECASPFSFLNVCQFFGLVPEQVRAQLIGDASSDAFSYWIRRCGRTASRLRSSVSHFFSDDRNGHPEPGEVIFRRLPSALGGVLHENIN